MTSSARRRLRRTLYLVGLLPSLLLLLLSVRIVVLLVDESDGLEAYRSAGFVEARDLFARNRVLNPVERWIAPFNEGDARFRLDDFDGAVDAFHAALEVVPEEHECVVRVNLALAYEALGDEARAEDREAADDAYEDGRAAVGPCLDLLDVPLRDRRRNPDPDPDPDPESEPDERQDPEVGADSRDQQQASDEVRRLRIAASRVEARLVRKLGGQAPESGLPQDDPPPEDDRTREKEREIQERNEQAQEDNVRHKDEFDEDAEPPPSPPPVPQW